VSGTATVTQPTGEGASGPQSRAFRGLVLVFLLSFLNLVGVVVTATALGGTEPWTRWQFIGIFGVLEVASGIANVISPNLWRLPIAELATSDRTHTKLAASALLIPHWGAVARCAAGAICLALVAWQVGLSPASIGLVPLVAAFAVAIVAVSAIVARAGVARPERDVVQFVVRWGGREREMMPLSIGASILQFALSIVTIPAAKLLPPSVLYQPELAPSAVMLAVSLLVAAVLTVVTYALWRGRVSREAPAEQQRDAEQHA
jgi:hypothetical protein